MEPKLLKDLSFSGRTFSCLYRFLEDKYFKACLPFDFDQLTTDDVKKIKDSEFFKFRQCGNKTVAEIRHVCGQKTEARITLEVENTELRRIIRQIRKLSSQIS